MATRKPRETTLIDDDLLKLNQEQIDFEEFIEEIGPTASVIDIFRFERDGSRGHLDQVALDILRENVFAFLRTEYGAGKYLLMFKGADRKYKGSKVLIVSEGKKPDGPPTNGHNPREKSNRLEEMEAQLALAQQRQHEMLMAMIAANGAKVMPDPAAMFASIVTAFATLKSAAEPPKTEDWIGKTKTIIELAKDLNPPAEGGGGDDNMWSVIKEVGSSAVKMLGDAAGSITAPAGPVPANTAPPQLPPGAVPMQNAKPAPTLADWIRTALTYLKAKAQLGKDVEIYVDWILDNPEEPQCGALISAIQRGATFPHLLQFDPEISQNPAYASWFESLYNGLLAEIRKADDSAGGGGNPPDAGNHAGSDLPGSD